MIAPDRPVPLPVWFATRCIVVLVRRRRRHSGNLDPASRLARLADTPAVLGKRIRVGLRAEVVEQACRALDVGEEECDGARREVATRAVRARARRSPSGERLADGVGHSPR